MPLQATSGAASQDAFGGNGVAVVPTYIEDVFSTYLFLGTQTTTTITNGIDLSGKGGLVWLKDRTAGGYHNLGDTARSGNVLYSNTTDAQSTVYPFAFTSTGFTLDGNLLDSGRNFVTWTFRKQPKFFDVQTWTGSGANRTISHSLGSVPGCIIVKRTDTPNNWQVYHGSLANTEYLVLNSTAAKATDATRWNSTTPTSTVFSLGTDASVNASGGTYVAYLFAHDAGGFGLTGTDNVISCGTYTGTSAVGNDQNLGFEPQWILIKRNTAGRDWEIIDNMRGWATNNVDARLQPNLSNAESTSSNVIDITSTGFNFSASGATSLNTSGVDYYYIAIRRGPMKVPTDATKVFAVADSAGSLPLTLTSNFKVDALMAERATTNIGLLASAITQRGMPSYQAFDESSFGSVGSGWTWDRQTGLTVTNWGGSGDLVSYCLGRAPSFMDICCYKGTGSNATQAHNLGVAPELMIVKSRTTSAAWAVYSNALANTEYLTWNTTAAKATGATWWNSTTPTASVFSIGTASEVNTSAADYVAYLFATCPGVSKVGSYTGTGTTLQINCGFTAGARFIYIKRTDATGDWYVWDSARGIIAGNDPYLLTNSNAAEVTGTDYVDPFAAGFELTSTAPAAINANGGTYIFLAIA